MEKRDEKDLQSFLRKVDDVQSIIQELNANDESIKENALKKADTYLGKVKAPGPAGFNKTLINKIEDELLPLQTKSEISPEEFMKGVEEDTERRTKTKTINKEKSLIWKEKGNAFFKEGKYSDAEHCYSEAIKLTPDEVTFYSNRAQAWIKLTKYEKALDDCETGLKLDKNFVKIHVHRGRSLTGLKRFDEAIIAFNKVLKIDKKQGKTIKEYIKEVEKERQRNEEEEKAVALLCSGDSRMQEIKSLVSPLLKGSPPDIWNGNGTIVKLKDLLSDVESRTVFRTSNGFDIFTQHPGFRNLIRKDHISREELNIVVNIISMLTNAIDGCEDNCDIVTQILGVINGAMHCLCFDDEPRIQVEGITFFHRISQFANSRANLLSSKSISPLLDKSLSLLGKGGDLAFIAMAVINNLALDNGFVPQFKEKLSLDFIPGVIKMMELLSLSYPNLSKTKGITKTFLPVMASSITTIANIFLNPELRKEKAEDGQTIWNACEKLLSKFVSQLEDQSVFKVVHATLSMLMNLSTHKIVFDVEFSRKWLTLSSTLISSAHHQIVEYCCGILNHVLASNEEMVNECINTKMCTHFIAVLKGDNATARRFILKCLALCASMDVTVAESIMSEKAVPSLIKCLDSTDEAVLGNSALVFAHCHVNRSIVFEVAKCQVIKKLLLHATNDNIVKTVRHNCAIAIGKYCLAEPKCLQQLRDLHGLEILHEVLKENKLV